MQTHDQLQAQSQFAGDVILMTKRMKQDQAGEYLSQQIIRSSCRTALNYGEVQGTLTNEIVVKIEIEIEIEIVVELEFELPLKLSLAILED